MHTSLKVGFMVVGLLAFAGCSAASTPEGGDPGDSEEAIGGATCDRGAILGAVKGARREVLTRGFRWLDQNVPYNQAASHEGYRTDCSGFVSMCWDLDESYTTETFFGGMKDESKLSSYDALLPGDALVRRTNGEGHIVLFAGWKDSSRSGACVIEQENTALDMQFHVRTTDSLQASGYKPVRSKRIPADDSGGSAGGGANGGPVGRITGERDVASHRVSEAVNGR